MTTTFLTNTIQRLGQKKISDRKLIDRRVFGRKIGLMTSLFGCWHENVGRPFVKANTAYRTCLDCGARRQFNTDTFETYGKFYSPPVV
jgi:hypothetical protein